MKYDILIIHHKKINTRVWITGACKFIYNKFINAKIFFLNLFPKDAETHIINLVKRMQANDTQIRNTNKSEK